MATTIGAKVATSGVAKTPLIGIARNVDDVTGWTVTNRSNRNGWSYPLISAVHRRGPLGLRKIDGQWKLDTTTISVDVGDPAAGNQSLKAVAISGIPTNGVSPVAILPGTSLVSSSNKYVDISAATQPLLLEALTNIAARPSIQPTVILNDSGRQASVAALEA